MFKAALAISLFALCSCSVYKSAQRKDFENVVPDHGNINAAAAAKTSDQTVCTKMETISAWLERTFPAQQQELLLSDENQEVWKTNAANGSVTIRLFRPVNEGVESCSHTFSSDKEWQRKGEAVLDDWGLALQ